MHAGCAVHHAGRVRRLARLILGGPLGAWSPVIGIAFLAGLVLPVWWLVSARHGGVPGLGHFPSAYLGDTVLLPLGCVMTAAGIGRLAAAPRERTVAIITAAVSAVVSVGIQADWLRDPSTQPNWTLPHSGKLDAAGWWHAAYFTGMSVLLAVLTLVFLARVRAGRLAGDRAVREVSSGTGAALLLAGWVSYTALAVHDDLSGPLASSAVSVLVVVGAVLLVAGTLIAVAYGRTASVLIRPALVAVGCAAAVTAFAAAPLAAQAALGAPMAIAACAMTAAAHFHGLSRSTDRPGVSQARAGRPACCPRASSQDGGPAPRAAAAGDGRQPLLQPPQEEQQRGSGWRGQDGQQDLRRVHGRPLCPGVSPEALPRDRHPAVSPWARRRCGACPEAGRDRHGRLWGGCRCSSPITCCQER